jgi:outer membrane biosynthesis protein TonB
MTEDEDLLAGIDLNTWQVPPPAPLDRATLLGRALSPATVPARRPRLRWLVAGIVLANAALATLIVIVLARPQPAPAVVAVQPAGAGSADARVQQLLLRLAQQDLELQAKVAELQAQQDLIRELQAKVQQCEERERTVPKKPRPAETCDEVSCVLNNYEGGCCMKYRRQPGLPEALDRTAISNGVASVQAKVASCKGTATGIVKVHVVVSPDGVVTSASILATPDPALGTCVLHAIQRAVFSRTQNGGSFSYPFVF